MVLRGRGTTSSTLPSAYRNSRAGCESTKPVAYQLMSVPAHVWSGDDVVLARGVQLAVPLEGLCVLFGVEVHVGRSGRRVVVGVFPRGFVIRFICPKVLESGRRTGDGCQGEQLLPPLGQLGQAAAGRGLAKLAGLSAPAALKFASLSVVTPPGPESVGARRGCGGPPSAGSVDGPQGPAPRGPGGRRAGRRRLLARSRPGLFVVPPSHCDVLVLLSTLSVCMRTIVSAGHSTGGGRIGGSVHPAPSSWTMYGCDAAAAATAAASALAVAAAAAGITPPPPSDSPPSNYY
eukprot:SAG22_NODE_375_length_11547_cov_12.885657_2_plen_290_part_00